jgi:serine/threonine-protein kinase
MRSARAEHDDGALLARLNALDETRWLGRYELLAPVGRGGMAIVWAARLRGTRGFTRTVAVKTMLPALSADPRFERMFLAEAEIASRIRHPNVCQIIDLGEDRGVLYLVMEWVDGYPLSTLLDAAKDARYGIPYGVAAWALAKAARGLQAAHELVDDLGKPLGIVHRDVSPQNILATPGGLVQVVDFGVAKAKARTENLTRSGYIKGKVAYLAPEQAEGTDIDGRADVFALGTVLYEMTTGEHPFRGATELSTLLRVCSAEPAPPPRPRDYPGALRAVLDRALQKDVRARYPSMREFASALEEYASRAQVADDAGAAFLADALAEPRERRALLLREAAQKADECVERRETAARAPPHPPATEKTRTHGTIDLEVRGGPLLSGPRSYAGLLALGVALAMASLGTLWLRTGRPAPSGPGTERSSSNTARLQHAAIPETHSEPNATGAPAPDGVGAASDVPLRALASTPPSAPGRTTTPFAAPAAAPPATRVPDGSRPVARSVASVSPLPEAGVQPEAAPSKGPAAPASASARFRDPGF